VRHPAVSGKFYIAATIRNKPVDFHGTIRYFDKHISDRRSRSIMVNSHFQTGLQMSGESGQHDLLREIFTDTQ